jgi:hypothetical protein
MNAKNGEVEMLCEGGQACVKAITDDMKRDANDPIRFNVNNKTTGNVYGFNVPKNGEIVFKKPQCL